MDGLSVLFDCRGGEVDTGQLRRMDEAAAHRGSIGTRWSAGAIGLAHRAVPPAGAQLAVDEARRLAIVWTGQLYNRAQVVAALPPSVIAPAASDAEVVLAAYAAWGAPCVGRLDGDFAYAVHDAERQAVVCARDALGVKPLFYAFDGRWFRAASEVKQLLAAGVSAQPCDEVVAAYLSLDDCATDLSRTFFRDVLRLAPGHYVVADGSGVTVERYWQIDPHHTIDERSQEEIADRLRELMVEAVACRIPPQGPYSCALSGGFDSSSVVGLLRRALDERGIDDPLETYSFELRDRDADEPEIIDAVAQDVRAHHHHLYLDRDDALEVLPAIIDAIDEPTRDMGLLYLLRKKQRAAQDGVRVVLSGLGGDELFLGRYHYYADLLRSGRLWQLGREVRAMYPVDKSTGKRISLRTLLFSYAIAPLLPRGPKKAVRGILRRDLPMMTWIDSDLARRTQLAERIKQGLPRLFRDAYRQECYESLERGLLHITLPIHEALGAACGVDTRFPLLDRRIVEYMFAVPREHKIGEGRSRIVQRRAMAGVLPEVVLREHLKKNLNTVLWRQQRDNFARAMQEVLDRPRHRSADYVDWTYLRTHQRELLDGGGIGRYGLWYAFNLERWLEQVVDGERPE